jgi:hypothetical protein
LESGWRGFLILNKNLLNCQIFLQLHFVHGLDEANANEDTNEPSRNFAHFLLDMPIFVEKALALLGANSSNGNNGRIHQRQSKMKPLTRNAKIPSFPQTLTGQNWFASLALPNWLWTHCGNKAMAMRKCNNI